MNSVNVEQLLTAALQMEEAKAPPLPATGWLQSLIDLRTLEAEHDLNHTQEQTTIEAENAAVLSRVLSGSA